jgi:glucosylglycerate phosphorylase
MFGSRGDRAGAESSGLPRRVNRQKLEQQELEAELADAGSLRGQVFGGFRRYLQMRGRHAAFHPCGEQQVLAIDSRLFAVRRISPDGADRMLCLHNVSDKTVPVPPPFGGGAGRVSPLSPYQVVWVEGI